jgi:hypothetical protein
MTGLILLGCALACPIMMGAMMLMMRGGHSRRDRDERDREE